MEFTNKIHFSNEFSRRPKLGFASYPVHQVLEDLNDPTSDTITVRCKPEEATGYAVYCLVQDGYLPLEEWVADLDTAEAADQLRGFLCNLCMMDNCRLLTGEILAQLKDGEVIATGVCFNSKLHAGLLKWVAYRLYGMGDWWIIKYHIGPELSDEYVKEKGDFILYEEIVRGLVPCDQVAWGLYVRPDK